METGILIEVYLIHSTFSRGDLSASVADRFFEQGDLSRVLLFISPGNYSVEAGRQSEFPPSVINKGSGTDRKTNNKSDTSDIFEKTLGGAINAR